MTSLESISTSDAMEWILDAASSVFHNIDTAKIRVNERIDLIIELGEVDGEYRVLSMNSPASLL